MNLTRLEKKAITELYVKQFNEAYQAYRSSGFDHDLAVSQAEFEANEHLRLAGSARKD